MRLTPLLLMAVVVAGCTAPSPPSASYEELLNSPIRGLTPAEIASLEEGSGSGLALPAELNGYPGPKHILELEEELGLNETQKQQVQALFDSMRADAQSNGRDVLDAYRALDQWFRAGGDDPAALDSLLNAVAEAEADLRGVHLGAHLAAVGLLTAHQRTMYGELRGYGGASHSSHSH